MLPFDLICYNRDVGIDFGVGVGVGVGVCVGVGVGNGVGVSVGFDCSWQQKHFSVTQLIEIVTNCFVLLKKISEQIHQNFNLKAVVRFMLDFYN